MDSYMSCIFYNSNYVCCIVVIITTAYYYYYYYGLKKAVFMRFLRLFLTT